VELGHHPVGWSVRRLHWWDDDLSKREISGSHVIRSCCEKELLLVLTLRGQWESFVNRDRGDLGQVGAVVGGCLVGTALILGCRGDCSGLSEHCALDKSKYLIYKGSPEIWGLPTHTRTMGNKIFPEQLGAQTIITKNWVL
jgi:hypothetical protein